MNKENKKRTKEHPAKVAGVKKKKRKVLKIVLLIILLIIIISASVFAYLTIKNGGGMKGMLSTVVGQNEEKRKNLSSIDFLLLGVSGNMSDTIIACTYDPNSGKASMLSIPRDTFVGKSEKGATPSDKINSIYNRTKDPMKTLAAINQITGLNLQHYVVVDTKALHELVDAIGGVYFDVPIDMNYEDTSEENYILIHLEKGYQKLNGSQAEQLVRFRHNDDGSTYPSEYGEQDLGRMRTQREFLTAVLKQTLQPGNIFKIGNLIDIAKNNVKTNISWDLMKDYIPYAVEFSTDNLETGMLPGDARYLGKYSFYLKSDSETQAMVSKLFFGGVDMDSVNPEIPTVQILNGTSDNALLEKAAKQIQELGYQIVKVGTTFTTSKTTIMNRTEQPEEIETKLQETLGTGVLKTGKDNVKADFTITIGKDYQS